MCPVCLAMSGLYNADGVSAGAVTTFWPPSCCASDPNRPHRQPFHRNRRRRPCDGRSCRHRWRGPPSCCSMKERNND